MIRCQNERFSKDLLERVQKHQCKKPFVVEINMLNFHVHLIFIAVKILFAGKSCNCFNGVFDNLAALSFWVGKNRVGLGAESEELVDHRPVDGYMVQILPLLEAD